MKQMKKVVAVLVMTAMLVMLMGSLKADEIRPLALNSGAAAMQIGKMKDAGFLMSNGLAEVYYSSRWLGNELGSGESVILPKGHYTFCVEPDKALVSSSGNEVSGSVGDKEFLKKLTTSRIQKQGKIFEMLGKVLAIAGPEETDGASLCSNAPEGTKYLAAQLIIWQIVYGDMNENFELLGDTWKKKGFETMPYWKTAPAGGRSIQSWYEEWMGQLKNAEKLPSFAAVKGEDTADYEMIGNTLRLIDKNGVLGYMNLTASEKSVSLTVEGNTLVIENPEHKDFTVTVENEIAADAKEPVPIMAYDTTAGTGTLNSRQTTIVESGTNLAAPIQGSFHVTAIGGTVEVEKVDSSETDVKLSGAVFALYRDEAAEDLLVSMPPTDANGLSRIEVEENLNRVYMKEVTAPEGYQIDGTVYPVTLTSGQTSRVTVSNQEQKGRLTIYKEGEILSEVISEEEGFRFIYETQRLPGVSFALYAAEDILGPGGKIVYEKGSLVQDDLITEEEGSVTTEELPLGVYEVKEKWAPEGFVCEAEGRRVTLSYMGQEVELSMGVITLLNERQKAAVHVYKKDAVTEVGLEGAIFGLFAEEDVKTANGTILISKGQLIEKTVSNEEGTVTFGSDLPFGSYKVEELIAPKGYVCSKESYSFIFEASEEGFPLQEFSDTFVNERMEAAIQVIKEDAEMGAVPQGDASLIGAVYGLYAREDIVYPDGQSGIIYPAGTQIETLTIDEERQAVIDGLYLGHYYIKELVPPVGYVLDETEYDVICEDEGDFVKVVQKNITMKEEVKRQAFQLIKVGQTGKSESVPLKGAGFTAYLISSLSLKEDGSYDFSSAEPVVITADGGIELFTDEMGYACSIPLPYGTYVVRESTIPDGYKPIDDFVIHITEHKPDEPQAWRVFIDEAFSAKLKITKKDAKTKETVLKAGTEFRILNLDTGEYVAQETTYPTMEVLDSFITNEEGALVLPEPLMQGHYQIEEVMPPEGYTLGEEVYEFSIESDGIYQVEAETEEAIIEINVENETVKGTLKIIKEGGNVEGEKETVLLPGAVFAVYAAENIYTPDYQKDAEGERRILYAKDTLMGSLTTDANGEAVLENLPLGHYYVEELKAPTGYVVDKTRKEFELVYQDEDTPELTVVLQLFNEREVKNTPVQTGDTMRIWPYITGVGTAGLLLMVTLMTEQKRRKRRGGQV